MDELIGENTDRISVLNNKSLLEERIKLAVEVTGIGTWDFDPQTSEAVYDEQCKKLFGFPPTGNFDYNNFLEIIDPLYREKREQVLQRALEGENDGRYETQYLIRTRDEGKVRWINSKGKVYFGPDKKPVRLIGTMLDITKEKLSEQFMEQMIQERTASLLEANRQLEASNQNLSEFAYVASHDLQEPLRKINTYSQLLKDKQYGEQSADIYNHLNRITDASKRMSRLIEDLLNYARLLNTEDASVPTDLKKIAETASQDFELEITQTNATIEIGELPVILATPIHMSQLFHNLFSNSLKFIPAGRKPVISIHSSSLTKEEVKNLESLNPELPYTRIIFSDNGIGFKPEFAEKIFTIFQRLNGRTEYAGTGIGLTISRKIVLNHHGLIFASSVENEGSQFTIILPIITAASLRKKMGAGK